MIPLRRASAKDNPISTSKRPEKQKPEEKKTNHLNNSLLLLTHALHIIIPPETAHGRIHPWETHGWRL